jgi:hypothetical protein
MKKINNPNLPSLEEFRGKNLANVLGGKYAEIMLEILLNFSFKENEWVAPNFDEISQAISEKLTTDVSYNDLVDGWMFLEESGYVKNDPCVDHNYAGNIINHNYVILTEKIQKILDVLKKKSIDEHCEF